MSRKVVCAPCSQGQHASRRTKRCPDKRCNCSCRAKKPRTAYEKVVLEQFIQTGVQAALQRAVDRLTSALFLACSTEVEAHGAQKRAQNTFAQNYWRGRRESAWTIRRHQHKLEATLKELYALLPNNPHTKSSKAELKAMLTRAKRLPKLKAPELGDDTSSALKQVRKLIARYENSDEDFSPYDSLKIVEDLLTKEESF